MPGPFSLGLELRAQRAAWVLLVVNVHVVVPRALRDLADELLVSLDASAVLGRRGEQRDDDRACDTLLAPDAVRGHRRADARHGDLEADLAGRRLISAFCRARLVRI